MHYVASTPETHIVNMSSSAKIAKTYNSGDSLVVTHLTTNPPVHCLYMAERTGSLVFNVLWSYVLELHVSFIYKLRILILATMDLTK